MGGSLGGPEVPLRDHPCSCPPAKGGTPARILLSILVAPILLALVTASAPTAMAQPPSDYWLDWTFEVEAPPSRLVPFTPTVVEMDVQVSCASPGLKLDQDPVSIHLSADGPEWLAVTFEPNPLTLPLSPEQCATGEDVEASGNVTLTVTGLAGPQLEGLTLKGRIDGQTHRDVPYPIIVGEYVAFDPQWVGPPEIVLQGDGWHRIRYVLDYQANRDVILEISAEGGVGNPLVMQEEGLFKTLQAGEGTVEGVYAFRPEMKMFQQDQEAEVRVVFAASTSDGGYRVISPLQIVPGEGAPIPAAHFLLLLPALYLLARRRPL